MVQAVPVHQLQPLLQKVGYPGAFNDMMLYPGEQRLNLITWIISKLLCGRAFETLPPHQRTDTVDGLPEERLAEKCEWLLRTLGMKATKADIRGSGGDQQAVQFLVDLLQLLIAASPFLDSPSSSSSAVPATPRGERSGSMTARGPCPRMTDMDAESKLLSYACSNVGKLCSEQLQLFPQDLLQTLDQSRDAVAELARLQPAAALQLQQLQQKLASLKTAVEPVPDDSWLHNMDQVQDTLQQFLATTSQLTDTYKQELSVWTAVRGADDDNEQEPASTLDMSVNIGDLARQAGTGYKNLRTLLQGVECLKDMHHSLMELQQDSVAQLATDSRADAISATTALRMLKG
eukprot:jgi/Chrzof1/3681/Cz13g04250.t1